MHIGRMAAVRQSRRSWFGRLLTLGGGALAAACSPPLSSSPPSAPTAAPARPVAPVQPQLPIAGRLVFVAQRNLRVWTGGQIRQLTHDGISRQPAWSPDGRFIAHIKMGQSASDVWVLAADREQAWRLTYYAQRGVGQSRWAFRPRYWPDGRKLLFLSDEGSYDLMVWRVNLDGSDRRPLLRIADREGGLDSPSIAPDQRTLLATAYRSGQSQVWTWVLPRGPWRQLSKAPDGAYDPSWSPDGTHVAYTVRQGQRHDIWVMGADGTGAAPLTYSGAARAPSWSPNGLAIAYLSAEGGSFDVWAAPAPASVAPLKAAGMPVARPRQLTRGTNSDAVSGLSWTR